MKALLATALAVTMLGAGAASAAPAHVVVGVHPVVHHRVIRHHRHRVCVIRHHRRTCFWR